MTAYVELSHRLSAIRRRIARWLPSAEFMPLWAVDYSEVAASMNRIERAVERLAGKLRGEGEDGPASATDHAPLQDDVGSIEAMLDEFEAILLDSLARRGEPPPAYSAA